MRRSPNADALVLTTPSSRLAVSFAVCLSNEHRNSCEPAAIRTNHHGVTRLKAIWSRTSTSWVRRGWKRISRSCEQIFCCITNSWTRLGTHQSKSGNRCRFRRPTYTLHRWTRAAMNYPTRRMGARNISVHSSAESVDTYCSTTIPGESLEPKSPFATPEPNHNHIFVPLTLTHTATGQAKLTLVCSCGGFKHVDDFDVNAPKSEA